jgi:FkbM family methyltransferase
MLSRNSRALGNIHPVNAAAGRSEAVLNLKDYGLRYAAWNTLAQNSRMPESVGDLAVQERAVKVLRLDDFVRSSEATPSLIKIDAENFEEEVVFGLEATFQKARPKVILETGSSASLSAGRYLLGLGYRPLFVQGEALVPCTEDLAVANAKWKDLLFVP